MTHPIAVLILALAPTLSAHAACVAQSGNARPHLIELYTSEGCDSCPPAERWLSGLHTHADVVTLEYHVDYWDGADWRDPFSDHAFTLRQQALAKRGNHDQIFTPQIWLDGQVWQNWPKGQPPALNETAAPSLRLSVDGGDPLRLALTSDAAQPQFRIYAALSENGLSEHVRGGENRGKTLNHDSVVRAFAGPFTLPQAQTELKVPPRMDVAKAAVVAFVEDMRDGRIVQALRLPLSECTK